MISYELFVRGVYHSHNLFMYPGLVCPFVAGRVWEMLNVMLLIMISYIDVNNVEYSSSRSTKRFWDA